MSLIHEDGTGLPDAEAYASADYADTYHGARGNSSWVDADLDVKEAALRKATDYIDAFYGARLRGVPVSASQSLAFPRHQFLLDVVEPVPLNFAVVKRAAAMLALKVINGVELFPDAEATVSKEVIGPIETTFALPTGERFPGVTDTLAPVLRPVVVASTSGGSFAKVRRT